MTSYGRVKSSTKPNYMEITATIVIISTNITEYEEDLDDIKVHGWEYDCIVYNKDEYLATLAVSNNQAINELADELEATKILLGVE